MRIVHWSLMLTFTIAYVTGEDESRLHDWAGYAVLGLVTLRCAWGFVGPRYARFSDFMRGPRAVFAYTLDLVRGRAQRHLGHNPLGGAMIAALLASLAITSVTGWILLDQKPGRPSAMLQPFVTAVSPAPSAYAKDRAKHERDDGPLKDFHEFFANLALLLVFLHIGGIAVGSLAHRENLVRAMFTGRKRR